MGRRKLHRNVIALGLVSLLTDASSEMIYPLLPVFLSVTLGAGPAILGAIEGIAETTAAMLKLFSGAASDRLGRKKPLVLAGYGLSSMMRPLMAFATGWGHVLAVRFADRIGKGVRTAPRDALVAAYVPPSDRGRAFGLQRSLDHLGAVIGPLAAFALLSWAGVPLRTVFLLSAIPGFAALLVLAFIVKEVAAPPPPAARPQLPARISHQPPTAAADTGISTALHSIGLLDVVSTTPASSSRRAPCIYARLHRLATGAGEKCGLDGSGLPGPFRGYLGAVVLFTLGNASDAFLVLRAVEEGVSVKYVPLLWGAFHVVKSALSTPLGALSDRWDRRKMIVGGWLVYAGTYAAWGVLHGPWTMVALFLVYALYSAATEGAERALVADFVGPERRGTAFGWFNLSVGIAALPASLLFGGLYAWKGAPVAFGVSASLALAASALLLLLVRTPRLQDTG